MLQKISQSFIKDYRAYLVGNECGYIIREKYVNDRLLGDEEEPGAMHLGSFFEYHLSGAIPKNGKIPRALNTADGTKMHPDYKRALESANLIKDYLQAMGLKIVKVGLQMDKGMFTGTIDLIVEVTRERVFDNGIKWTVGKRFVIDLKYSGFVGRDSDRQNKHGWSWSKAQKEYHGTQAKQYHLISGLPFYFMVTQSNPKVGEKPICKLFFIPIDEFMLDQHIMEGKALFENFQIKSKVNDFKPYPSMKRCGKCPLRDECEDKHTYPRPEIVDLSIE